MSVLQISLNKARDIQLSRVVQEDATLHGLSTDEAFRTLGFRAMDQIVPIQQVEKQEIKS